MPKITRRAFLKNSVSAALALAAGSALVQSLLPVDSGAGDTNTEAMPKTEAIKKLFPEGTVLSDEPGRSDFDCFAKNDLVYDRYAEWVAALESSRKEYEYRYELFRVFNETKET